MVLVWFVVSFHAGMFLESLWYWFVVPSLLVFFVCSFDVLVSSAFFALKVSLYTSL